MAKPILCVDFDGVVHSYSSGWHGATIINDPPVPGALRWLWAAHEYWDVQIYSSRTKEEGGCEAMQAWLRHHALQEWNAYLDEEVYAFVDNQFLPAITFPRQKPAAFLTIDDRAVCFDGDWSKLDPQALLAFRPWNARSPS